MSDPTYVFRPIDVWPQPSTNRRTRGLFSASYSDTVDLLRRECRLLGATRVVVQIATDESGIRVDGTGPLAGAKVHHPGVIVALDSRHGPLKYLTDEFRHWIDNLRAIALSLEALRKVDRYGVSKRGEQYVGWRALPSGTGMTVEQATELIIERYGGRRQALRATHPDGGGSADAFRQVQEALAVLGEG